MDWDREHWHRGRSVVGSTEIECPVVSPYVIESRVYLALAKSLIEYFHSSSASSVDGSESELYGSNAGQSDQGDKHGRQRELPSGGHSAVPSGVPAVSSLTANSIFATLDDNRDQGRRASVAGSENERPESHADSGDEAGP